MTPSPLIDGDMVIRPLLPTDQPEIARLANNLSIWNNLRDAMPHPYTELDAAAFIKGAQIFGPNYTMAITQKQQLCGIITLLTQSDIYAHSAEIGFWLGQEYWGQNLMTRAVSLYVEFGFSKLHLQRIYARVFEYNKGSMRVLEKNHFEPEGIGRLAMQKNGKLWDEHRFALIRPTS